MFALTSAGDSRGPRPSVRRGRLSSLDVCQPSGTCIPQTRRVRSVRARLSRRPTETETERLSRDVVELATEALPQWDLGIFDVQASCEIFTDLLVALDREQTRLKVKQACRKYRAGFSVNYSALFPDRFGRNYRGEILVGAQQAHEGMSLNGTFEPFHTETIVAGHRLVQAWQQCMTVVMEGRPWSVVGPELASFDYFWAEYERRYLSELMKMEERVRSFVRSIGDALQSYFVGGQRLASLELAVSMINELNSMANANGKGRDDMNSSVIVRAEHVLQSCQEEDKSVHAVAQHVLTAFRKLWEYFQWLCPRIERLNTMLARNAGLCEHLTAWEDAWAIGRDFLCGTQEERAAFVADVSALREATARHSQLLAWIEDSDVQALLAVPRLLVLRAVKSEEQGSVMRFAEDKTQLDALRRAASVVGDVAMVEAAVFGVEDEVRCGRVKSPVQVVKSMRRLDAFRLLESISLQVQRSNAQDWNHYLQAVVHTAAGSWDQAPLQQRV